MRYRIVGLVAALTVLLLTALPASAAHAVTLADRGLLRDEGQTAILEVVVTCETAGTLHASASIQQPSGRSWASGSGSDSESCGAGGTTTLFVPVTSQYAAFKSGPAEARVSVAHCPATFGGCHSVVVTGTVRLHK